MRIQEVNLPFQRWIAWFTLAFASCFAMRADASLQLDLDLDASKNKWALALADELSSQVNTTTTSSSVPLELEQQTTSRHVDQTFLKKRRSLQELKLARAVWLGSLVSGWK